MQRNGLNRFWRALPPGARGLAGLGVVTLLAWIVALAFPSRTLVQVVITDDGAVGRINEQKEGLTIPADAIPADGHFGWYVAGPSESLYYQPADESAPLAALGGVSEWLQSLRPSASWEFLPSPSEAGGDPAPTHWQPLAGSPTEAGAGAAVDPTTRTIPRAHLYGELVGGQVPAGLFIHSDAAGNGYAFVIRPERRGISWWRVEHGVPTVELDEATYRPAFWASVADLIQEAAIALTAALVLSLLALALALVWSRISRRQTAAGNQPSAVRDQESETRNTEHGTRNTQYALRSWLPPLAFGLAGVAAAAWAGLGPLEGIPHVQDDVAYLWQAKIFALGHASVPAPLYKEFFEQGFILMTDGRWFTKYPPGWPLLLVPGVWAGVPWLVNPLCAGASLALIYLTGRRLYGTAAGFWAALLGLTSPFVLFMSGSYMSHPSTMLAVTVALYCFVRLKTAGSRPQAAGSDKGSGDADEALVAHTEHGTRNMEPATRSTQSAILSLLVGFSLSWAFISREATAVGVTLPFVVWGAADVIGAGIAQVRRQANGRATRRRVAPYALMMLGALPPLIILGVVNQALLGSPFELAQALVGSYDRLGFGPGFGPEEGGHTPALGLYNALVYIRTLKDVLFGWPPPLVFAPLVLALIALPGRPWRVARWDLFLLGGVLGLAGIYFAWWSATTVFGPRYWYEGLPFLLLLSGRGIQVLGDWVRDLSPRPAPRRRGEGVAPFPPREGGRGVRLIPAVLIALLVAYNLAQVMPGQVREYTGYNDVDASSLRRVAEAGITNAIVYVQLQPDYPRRDYGKVFFANDPLLQGPIIFVRDLGPHNVALFSVFPGRQPYYLPLTGPPKPGTSP